MKSLFRTAKDNPIITAASIVTAISVIGGGALTMDSRYERRAEAQQRYDSLQQQYDRTRYSMVLADISRLTDTRQRRRLTTDEERWLQSLQVERRQLACQLRIEKC